MSRRRTPPQVPGDVRWVSVRVVCTGRDRHSRHSWGAVEVHPAAGMVDSSLTPSESYVANPAASKMDRGEVPTETDIRGMHKTYIFRCPRCRSRADYRLTAENLEVLARGIADADAPKRLDLSALHALPASI